MSRAQRDAHPRWGFIPRRLGGCEGLVKKPVSDSYVGALPHRGDPCDEVLLLMAPFTAEQARLTSLTPLTPHPS